jgi:hypothetical protein
MERREWYMVGQLKADWSRDWGVCVLVAKALLGPTSLSGCRVQGVVRQKWANDVNGGCRE